MTNHVLSGALLGAAAPGPASALVAGLGSHFLLDAVPHWGDVEWEEMVPIGVRDGLLGLAAMALMWSRSARPARLRVLAGMSGAAFPDLDKPSLLFFGRSPFPARFDELHQAIQRESRDRMTQELVVGASLAAVALALLPRASRQGSDDAA